MEAGRAQNARGGAEAVALSSVLVVIVNWCRAADTIECVDSVIRSSGVAFDVAIVENSSPDASYEDIYRYLSTLGEIVDKSTTYDMLTFRIVVSGVGALDIHLIRSVENLGFAGGNNLGLQAVGVLNRYRYIWFLNNDTIVQPDSLRALVSRTLQSPRVDICGSTLLYSNRQAIVQCLGGGSGSIWSGMTSEIGNGRVWPCAVDEACPLSSH
jgi:GT2 family glycosyltransferase